MWRKSNRPRRPRHYRIPVETYLILLGLAFAFSVAISLLDQPKEVSYLPKHTFSVRDPAFMPSAHALANPSPLKGNRVELLENGDQIFPAMLAAIDGARETVNLETYIFWSGTIASRFRESLAAAARRGVEVRVVLDAVGTGRKLAEGDLRAMREAGCVVEFFHKVRPWMLDALNHRTHRRLLVVDGRVGFTGSSGVADAWLGNADSPEHWRDTQVRVEGPVVAELQAAFQETWGEVRGEALAGDRFYPRLEPAGPAQAQVLSSSGRASSSATKLLYAVSIAAASERILLANSYFVPDQEAVELFSDAAKRGVDIRILVPGKFNDVPMTKAAGKSGFGGLLNAGIKIYEYQPTMMHTKTMVVDGLFATIGSTNFDNRSFRLNEELNLTVYDGDFASKLERSFWEDLKKSRPYTLRDWERRPLKERLAEWALIPLRSQL
ncbi:MAG TPA: phospholipase D-like domain-containing protein [Thermoanaerobaculia bacterium]